MIQVTIKEQEVREEGNHIVLRTGDAFYTVTVNGTSYYFVKETGEYDGWGRDVVEGEEYKFGEEGA